MVDTLNIPQLLKLLKGLKSYPKGTPGHGVKKRIIAYDDKPPKTC